MRPTLLALVLASLSAGPARADVPATRIAFLVGGRLNFGDLGEHYRYGYMFGGEAGYHWGALGFNWSLLGGVLDSARPDNPDTELGILELGLSLRGRVYVGGSSVRSFLVGQAGGEFMRTSIPVGDDGTRSHVGPFAGGGLESIFECPLADACMVMLGSHYALIPFEPSGVTLFLSFGVGAQ